MVDLGAGGGGRGEDVLPQAPGTREGLLVGRHDADAAAQEHGVAVGDVLGARVVDQHHARRRRRQVLGHLGQRGRRGLHARGAGSSGGGGVVGELLEDSGGVQVAVVVVEEGPLARGDVAQVELRAGAPGGQGLELG